MIVNVSEAKAKLSKLIDLVIHKPSGRRKLGIIAGEIGISEGIFKEDEEINQLFYGQNDKNHF